VRVADRGAPVSTGDAREAPPSIGTAPARVPEQQQPYETVLTGTPVEVRCGSASEFQRLMFNLERNDLSRPSPRPS